MVRVYSNDSSNPTTQLKISARTNDPDIKLQLEPLQPSLGEILQGKEGKLTVELMNTDSTTIRLAMVSEPSKEYVKSYRIADNTLNPEESTAIDFDLNRDIPVGEFSTTMTLEIKGHPDIRFSIPVEGKVVDKLSQAKK
jgi:hypothetical protein